MKKPVPRIETYKDGVIIRLHNRRILIKEYKNGFKFEFHNIIEGRVWKPVRVKRLKNKLSIVTINLTKEATKGIVLGLIDYAKENGKK